MSNEKTIKLKDIKKLDVNPGDTIVLEHGALGEENVGILSDLLKCTVVVVEDLDKIGVLKFKEK